MSWTEIARRQHGVLTYRQLRDAGVGAAALATLHRRGVLTPDSYGREVWQVAGAPTTTLTHCWAAFLRTGGTLSHYTAGWLWAMLPAPTVGAGLHVTLSGRKPLRRLPGVIMHRVPLTAKERTERDGLLLTTRSRTVIDCVRVLPRRPAITLLDRALQQKWISLDQLDTELALTKGRHGTPQLRALRAACAEGDAESERRLHRILRSAGIRGWVANASIDVGFAVLTFDVVFAALRLIVEVDGWATHSDPERFTADRTRQNAVEVRGWRVLRFTWDHVANRPEYVARSVREMVAQLSAAA